jgi:hypothetical protein
MDPMSFVSPYYGSMAVVYTWTGEMHGYRAIDNFNTVDPGERKYIPDPSLKRTNRDRRQCRRIRNDMDESEAGGPTRQCFLCSAWGHKDDKCPTFYQTELLEDVRIEEEEVVEEEEPRQFVTNYVFICNM